MKVIYNFNEEEKNQVTIEQSFQEHDHMIDLLIRASVVASLEHDLQLSDQLIRLKNKLRNWKAKWEL